MAEPLNGLDDSYTGVRVGKPSMLNDSNFETLTPQVCRLNDRTYSAPVMVDIEYTVDQGNKKYVRRWRGDVVIGYIPIMLKSCACILNGKDEAELTYYGECPLDPGGYFIVKGNEKVIVTQEELSNNHIHIETDSKGRVTASVASSTYKKKSKTLFVMENEKIYLQLNQFTKLIPIIVVMKAMGIESDQEVVQMIGRDPRYGDLLFSSLQECASEKIYTKQQALHYMDDKSEAILRDVFLAHVPVNNGNFRAKCIYTGVMLRRMMDAINADIFDDKVIENNATITFGLERAINTGNWDLGRYGMSRKGVSQPLSRLSYLASLGYLTRISTEFEKTRKISGLRALKPSQDGVRTFDDFLYDGLIEYLDVNEENNALCAMGKQAIGNIAYNQVGYDKLGAGQNATVAVMSYSGYDAKDAIVLNKSSLDRGFGRCIVMKKYTVKMQKYQDGISEKNVKPERDKDGKMFELIGGKASVVAGGVDGRFHYGTAFGEPSGNADEVENMRLAMELLELQFF
ncbi:hypothetical protein ACQ4PT_028931 [Festuca glaucescens]